MLFDVQGNGMPTSYRPISPHAMPTVAVLLPLNTVAIASTTKCPPLLTYREAKTFKKPYASLAPRYAFSTASHYIHEQ